MSTYESSAPGHFSQHETANASLTAEPSDAEAQLAAEQNGSGVQLATGQNGAGVGVIARTDANISEKHPAWHDKSGKFRPGNPGGHGRRPDKHLIAAITQQFPPETVAAMLQAAYDRAEERGSWRGQLEIARLVIEYTVGKPVRRSISVSTKLDRILSRLEYVDTGSDEAARIIDSVAEEADDSE